MTARRSETSDDYPGVVAVLNSRWRVVACAGAVPLQGIQWILQGRGKQGRSSSETSPTADWRGRSFCRTKEALIRPGAAPWGPRKLCHTHCRKARLPIDPQALAILAALPDRFPEIGMKDIPITSEPAGPGVFEQAAE